MSLFINHSNQKDCEIDEACYINACMVPSDMTQMEKYDDLKKIFTGTLDSFNLYDTMKENTKDNKFQLYKMKLIRLPETNHSKIINPQKISNICF